MKKLSAIMLALALLLCGVAALAETDTEDAGDKVNCLIEEGSFIIQIDDPEGDLGWEADDMAQDDSIVKLYSAELVEDTFVVRYDPVGDGDVTVAVRHYTGIACDELYTFDLHVEGGAVTEEVSGSYAAAPNDEDVDPIIVGEWVDQETQSAALTIAKNPEGGWDVEIAAAQTEGAFIFKATVYADCELEGFVYDDGEFWNVPITDSEEETELGEATISGSTGAFTFEGDDENVLLVWYSDVTPEETVAFEPAA